MTRSPTRHADLEAAIDAVAASYRGAEEINSLESAALPNKRAVIEAFDHLKPVIYLGFYSTRSLTPENLRQTIAEHLYPAYEILVDQIFRVFTYEKATGRAPAAAYDGDPAAKSVEEVVFSYPAIEAITAYRVAHVLYHEIPMIPRIISEFAHSKTGIDIHPGAQ